MSTLPITAQSRVTYSPHEQAIRTWFDTTTQLKSKEDQSPRDFAFETLKDSASQLGWQPPLSDIRDHGMLNNGTTLSVRFFQEFKGVPVDASEVIVNMYKDGPIYSLYNNYHYDIPKVIDPQKIKIRKKEARDLVERLFHGFKEPEIREGGLIVYQFHRSTNRPPKRTPNEVRDSFLAEATAQMTGPDNETAASLEGKYFLTWDFRVLTKAPVATYWRILVDANTGRVVNIIDLARYATGTGKVFDPNPIVTSGNTALRHNSAAATINSERRNVTLEHLNPADGTGNLHLDGSLVNINELESPGVAEPLSTTGDFNFSFDDNNFLSAMAYFHIDRFQNYVQTTLGLNNVANYSIQVDPQGFNSDDNSHYVGGSGTGYIAFGGGTIPVPAGNPVPDASDAMVVLHEYGHAIQDNTNPGFDNYATGLGEGFGDFLSAVFFDDKHANPSVTRGFMMSWDSEMATGSWPGRRYDMAWLFDGPEYAALGGNGHAKGQLWCATLFELYRKLGGDSQYPSVKAAARDLIIRLHLMANFNVSSSSATVTTMAQQIEAADINLGGWRYANGLHKKVIYDTFRRRHLSGYNPLAADVYINDGRNGGYGSLSGNDLFTEKQFLDNYWSTQDLWVKIAPYANDADQQAGDPGDHVEPVVGSPAYLFVRVKNKGTTGSGPVTLKAYHSDPTIGLVWPNDWTPADTASLSVADIPAGGHHIFGPFPWTPSHVGHECVFAIAECANDRAITQDLLPTDVVPHAALVPFDNNIAQRNLYPTAAKGKMVRGFWVSNPDFDKAVVTLHFESTLPKGWGFHSNMENLEAIHLAPRERKWVEVTIDQGTGEEVREFTSMQGLTISGTIKDRLIGGMSFYIAPPSAFPKPSHHGLPHQHLTDISGDLLNLNIPWKDCDFEGEIDIKLRFRSKK